MGWADNYIEELKKGRNVQFRPRGPSMSGLIESGQLVTVQPILWTFKDDLPPMHWPLEVGDIVLCKVKGKQYLHKITATRRPQSYQISNNHGKVNGWTTRKNIYGIVVKVEP